MFVQLIQLFMKSSLPASSAQYTHTYTETRLNSFTVWWISYFCLGFFQFWHKGQIISNSNENGDFSSLHWHFKAVSSNYSVYFEVCYRNVIKTINNLIYAIQLCSLLVTIQPISGRSVYVFLEIRFNSVYVFSYL